MKSITTHTPPFWASIGHISVNDYDLHLHWIYMLYIHMTIDTYTHNTGPNPFYTTLRLYTSSKV